MPPGASTSGKKPATLLTKWLSVPTTVSSQTPLQNDDGSVAHNAAPAQSPSIDPRQDVSSHEGSVCYLFFFLPPQVFF